MNATILGIISSVLAMVIGVWRYYGRRNRTKRKLADEAEKKLDKAHKDKNKSDLLDSWDNINRM